MTPSQTEVVIKAYLTPREMRVIEKAPLRAASVGTRQVTDSKDGISLKSEPYVKDYDLGAGSIEAENETIIQGVVSFGRDADGKPMTDRILDRILDGRVEDFKFIVAELETMMKNPAEPK